jgi:multidrug efflux pump subunit AcrA (membrane-fusion protein)
MKNLKSWQWAGIVLFTAVAGLVVYGFWPSLTGSEAAERRPESGQEGSSRRANVDVMIVEPSDFVLRVEATGHLTPWRSTALSSEGSGVVLTRPHEEGAYVREGEILLQLDSREQEIALAEAESDLLNAQSEFATFTAFRGDMVVDSSGSAAARARYAAAQSAHESGQITNRELTAARRAKDMAVLRSGERRADVEAVVSGLSQAESRVDRARLAVSRMRLTAPFSGHLADINVEIGQRVGQGQEIMRLLQDSRMRVEVDVLESDMASIQLGGTARVRVPALEGREITGTVYSINPSVDPAKGTGRVTVALPNADGALISGLFAYVELEAGRLSERVVVPTEALLVRQGRDLVFVVNGGKAKWTYVVVGRRSGDFVEITESLSAGDSLAVAGHHALSHDAAVKVENVVEGVQ